MAACECDQSLQIPVRLLRFKHSDRLAGHKAVQDVWAEIYFIRPHDRPGLGIKASLDRKTLCLKWTEDTAATDDALFEV